MADLTIGIALVAGLVSFLSPCILPLVPAFLSYLVGTSSGTNNYRLRIFINSLFFVLGFSIIFTLLGIALNTFLSNISFALKQWVGRIGGIVIIIFGLYLLKIIKLSFLEKEHKFKVKSKYGYFSSFLFGTAFAFGWTPCVGAILGSILTLAIVNPGSATSLLFAYSLGLGVPFLLVGLFTSEAYNLISKSEKFLKYFNIIVGIILLILGILVFFNLLVRLSSFTFAEALLLKYS